MWARDNSVLASAHGPSTRTGAVNAAPANTVDRVVRYFTVSGEAASHTTQSRYAQHPGQERLPATQHRADMHRIQWELRGFEAARAAHLGFAIIGGGCSM